MDRATLLFWLYAVISIVDAALTWSKNYHLKAVLTVPRANITEPYEIWYDGDTESSRVDFYNGVVKIYRTLSKGKWLYDYSKVHPETTEKFVNKQVCHTISPDTTEIRMFSINSYLPQKNFRYINNEKINGIQTQKWQYSATTDKMFNVTNIYTVWIKLDKSPKSSSVPVRYVYEMKAGDILLDYYCHDYSSFEDIKSSNDVYEIPSGLLCSPLLDISVHEPVDPLLEFIDPLLEHSRISLAFDRFKWKYNKTYGSEMEHFKRINVFKNNLRYINSVNREHRSYSLAVNHLVDLSDEELNVFLGTKHPVEDNVYDLKLGEEDDDDDQVDGDKEDNLNVSLDWRDYGAVTPVKDQTYFCGACYAFTTAAAIESAAYVSRGCKHLEEVSEQALVDCTWSTGYAGNLGCSGGTYEFTLAWAKKHGVPMKQEYGPYLAMEGLCHNMNMTKLTMIHSSVEINKKKSAIKKSLQKHGPLLAAVNGSPKTFSFYNKGIYDDPRCRTEPDFRTHGVTIIGYGKEAGQEYWIIKNSFGTEWGEDGYMRLATKHNVCGLKNFVYSVGFKISKVDQCFMK